MSTPDQTMRERVAEEIHRGDMKQLHGRVGVKRAGLAWAHLDDTRRGSYLTRADNAIAFRALRDPSWSPGKCWEGRG